MTRSIRLSLGLLLLMLWSHLHAGELDGWVMRVSGGDTLQLIAQGTPYRVRLQGIAAPPAETPMGRAARRGLEMLVLGKPVRIRYKRTDARGRLLGMVTLGGMDMALRQLQRGLVRYREEPVLTPEQRRLYRSAERQARTRGLGLWRHPPGVRN